MIERKSLLNILWDFDGTLFDTYKVFTEVMHEVLKKSIHKNDIFKELKISFTHATTFFNLTNNQILEFKEKEKSISPEMKQPFPYVEDILKQANLNVIMTHKPRKEVQAILDYYDWNDYFVEIVAGDDGYKRKPDPASYEYLHNKYKLDIAIGDRVLDIIPAKKIGLYTCLFQNEAQGADFYLDSYKDFFEKVKIN
jgi:HAD superfamily hydrolase (TIGR01549 family)